MPTTLAKPSGFKTDPSGTELIWDCPGSEHCVVTVNPGGKSWETNNSFVLMDQKVPAKFLVGQTYEITVKAVAPDKSESDISKVSIKVLPGAKIEILPEKVRDRTDDVLDALANLASGIGAIPANVVAGVTQGLDPLIQQLVRNDNTKTEKLGGIQATLSNIENRQKEPEPNHWARFIIVGGIMLLLLLLILWGMLSHYNGTRQQVAVGSVGTNSVGVLTSKSGENQINMVGISGGGFTNCTINIYQKSLNNSGKLDEDNQVWLTPDMAVRYEKPRLAPPTPAEPPPVKVPQAIEPPSPQTGQLTQPPPPPDQQQSSVFERTDGYRPPVYVRIPSYNSGFNYTDGYNPPSYVNYRNSGGYGSYNRTDGYRSPSYVRVVNCW